jgi:beta-fructofuranosidase
MLFLLLSYLSFSLSFSPVVAQSATTSSAVPTGTAIAGTYDGAYRPQIHFSPPVGFMNDPNGMFLDANGVYHLYYQYNPTDTIAGNQHWGHATSEDLYHWTNQQIALFPYDNVTGIFSGSAVVDVNNTSGFFPNQTNGVVAMYTAHGPDDQNQAIAYSFDDGYTFSRYEKNPVLAIGSTQFRDPKVIWHAATETWVMVLAFAQDFTIGIYTSPNLTSWEHVSNFSYHGILGLQYECPNMVPIPYLDADGSLISDEMYLMYISINPGAPLGGSIGEYFPGTFNGTHFTAVDSAARIADFGKDNYAAQFFYEVGESGADVRGRKSVAWASNWQYTNNVPSGPREGWQSAMTVARRNWLENRGRLGWSLMALPVDMSPIIGEQIYSNDSLGNGTATTTATNVTGAMMFQVNITNLNTTGLSKTASLNFTISSSTSGESLSGGQYFNGDFWLDRGRSGWGQENPFFTDKVSTSLVLEDTYQLLVVVDRSVIEVFLDGGVRSGTQTFYSDGLMDSVIVSCNGLMEGAEVSVGVWELKSAWADYENGEGVVTGNATEVRRRGVRAGEFWA